MIASILFFGCSSEEELEPAINESLEIQVGSETIVFTGEKLIINENCNSIFINTAAVTVDDTRFRIGINLTKNGRIKEINYWDLSGVIGRQFKTADFISSKVFSIDNFQFSESERTLRFGFEGLLYEVDQSENTKKISGEVITDNLQFTNCMADEWEIRADIDGEPFVAVEIEGETLTITDIQDQILSVQSSWIGISDDGFRISIVTNDELENMAIGTYFFSENDFTNRITLEEYEGAYEAVMLKERNGAWKNFECEGKFIIDEQTGGMSSMTRGRFSLQASKGGEIIYSITNGTFSI